MGILNLREHSTACAWRGQKQWGANGKPEALVHAWLLYRRLWGHESQPLKGVCFPGRLQIGTLPVPEGDMKITPYTGI
jgi:hypothetical protein